MEQFNKFAAKEGLRYVALEFKSIENELKEIVKAYRKDFSLNYKNKPSEDDMTTVLRILDRNKKLLNEFKTKIKSMVGNFIKSIERNHKKEIVQHLGEDYEQYLTSIISSPDEAYNPVKGAYIKYKLIFQLLSGDDRDLINRVTKYIEYEVKIYENNFSNLRREIEQIRLIGLGKDITDYSWTEKYKHLFKFAEEIITPEEIEDVNIKSIGLKLKDVEIKTLKAIIELWKLYKAEFDTSKFAAILENRMDLLRRISGGFVEIEKSRNDMLESTFDSIRALHKYINDYITDGNKEGDFYDITGLTFANAFAIIDKFVYSLATLFPASAKISRFLSKMPRTYKPSDAPKVILNEKAIENAPEYATKPQKEKELIFKDFLRQMPKRMPTQVPAMAYYQQVFDLIKKANEKK